MSSAEMDTRSRDVLARERIIVSISIGRQPASEMEQSAIELCTADSSTAVRATARERDGAKRNRAAHCGVYY